MLRTIRVHSHQQEMAIIRDMLTRNGAYILGYVHIEGFVGEIVATLRFDPVPMNELDLHKRSDWAWLKRAKFVSADG